MENLGKFQLVLKALGAVKGKGSVVLEQDGDGARSDRD